MNEVENILVEMEPYLADEQCRSCECLQSLIVQLQIDQLGEIEELQSLRVPKNQMHACLGCDPCPPGKRYSEYLLYKQSLTDSNTKKL